MTKNTVMRAAIQGASVPARLIRRILDEKRAEQKGRSCSLAKGAVLYPKCRIQNDQLDASAISIGAYSQISGDLVALAPRGKIQIGEYCFIGEGTRIWAALDVVIGSRVLVSHGVNIHDTISHSKSAAGRHDHFKRIFFEKNPRLDDPPPEAPISIEDDVWIGFNSVILKGVKIGRGAIVGAASVVTSDVAAYTIVVGNPARVVGTSSP